MIHSKSCPRNWSIVRGPREAVTVKAENDASRCTTDTRSSLGNNIQHRLEIRRLAGDHAKNLTRCRLLLQGFGEIAITRLQFLKQPDVLDGDHGLGGEGFKQFYLFFREGANFSAANMNRSDRNGFSH